MNEIAKSENPIKKQDRVELPWAQARRLEFIDYRLQWDGHINRSDLTNFFGISTPQASIDLAEYQKVAPGNLDYDPSTKTYRASELFKAMFQSTSSERYLEDLLQAHFMPEMPLRSFLGWSPTLATVPRLSRRLDSTITVEVVGAIRCHDLMRISYLSLSSPEPTLRSVSPHALVHDGFRWHMRAFCHLRKSFRDFNLSRILSVKSRERDFDRSKEDLEWNNYIRLEFAPNPKLSQSHRALIELDYGMENGVCSLECREALLFYLFQQLGLANETAAKSPTSHHIVLKNRKDLRKVIEGLIGNSRG